MTTLYHNRKAYFAAKKKEQRNSRIDKVNFHNQVLSTQDKPLGFTAKRLKESGEIVNLPPYMNHVFKACQEFIDNPYRFKSLRLHGGHGVRYINVRKNIAKVLVVLLARSDLIDGRIGVPTTEGIDTISHNQLMNDYALRFGQMIEDKTWYTTLNYLKRCGFLHQVKINVSLPGTNGTPKIRSAASFKQFTISFIKELKVTLYNNVAKMIHDTRFVQSSKGYKFDWIPFMVIANRLATILTVPTIAVGQPSALATKPPH